MNIETIFQDLGIDAIRGVQLIDQLDINTAELASPQRFTRLKEIIEYFKQFPEDTQRFLINKAVRGKQVDKLNHVYEYTTILKEKGKFESMLSKIEAEKSALDGTDSMQDQENFNRIISLSEQAMDIRRNVSRLSDELSIYEK